MGNKNTKQEKPDKIIYKFKCGIEAYQEELSYPKWSESIKLISGDVPDEKKRDVTLLELMVNQDTSLKLVDICLTVTKSPKDFQGKNYNKWAVLKGSEVTKVIADFFTLNPESLLIFGIGRLKAGLK